MDTITRGKPTTTAQVEATSLRDRRKSREADLGLTATIWKAGDVSQVGGETQDFKVLEGHRCMNLTSFRKSGQPVTTTVWFALKDTRAYVVTDKASGKIKRIHSNPQVVLAPSTHSGELLGPSVSGEARILPMREHEKAAEALHTKYGWQMRFFELIWRVMRKQHTFLEIVPRRG